MDTSDTPDTTKMAERVFEKIAVTATESVPGAITRDSKLAGLAGSKLPKFVAIMDRPSNKVSFDAELAMQFPAPARAIIAQVREAVSKHISALTGFEVARINITVSTFAACSPGTRITREQLAQHSTDVATRPIQAQESTPRSPQVKSQRPLRPIVVKPSPAVQTSGFLEAVPDLTPWSPTTPAPTPLRPIGVVPLGGLL